MGPIEFYKKTEITTSDSVTIVYLLFEGAVNFMNQALIKLEEGDIQGKGQCLSRATAIVTELSNSLDMNAGEAAHNLNRLYDYVLMRLLHANMHNDPEAIENSLAVLGSLRGTWKELMKARSASDEEHEASSMLVVRV